MYQNFFRVQVQYFALYTLFTYTVLQGRVEWFQNKRYRFYVVPKCCRILFPKFHVLLLPFSLVAGPQKKIDCYPKISTQKFFCLTFINPREGERLCDFLKMKTLPSVRRVCALRTAEIADFLELNFLKYTWSTEMWRFSKIEKVLNHSTLVQVSPFASQNFLRDHAVFQVVFQGKCRWRFFAGTFLARLWGALHHFLVF